jgi:hypothetical protein
MLLIPKNENNTHCTETAIFRAGSVYGIHLVRIRDKVVDTSIIKNPTADRCGQGPGVAT